jgi:hypothetical protein
LIATLLPARVVATHVLTSAAVLLLLAVLLR